jgi:hypothetical protein
LQRFSSVSAFIASVPGERVVASLDFGAMGTAQAAFLLPPDGEATRITWTLDTDLPYTGSPG